MRLSRKVNVLESLFCARGVSTIMQSMSVVSVVPSHRGRLLVADGVLVSDADKFWVMLFMCVVLALVGGGDSVNRSFP